MGKILVTFPMDEKQREELRRIAPEAELIFLPRREVTEEIISDAEALLGNVRPPLLKAAKKLRWMQLQSAGAESYIAKGVLPEGAVLTNAAGAYGTAVGEHFLAMLLSLYKKLHLYRDRQREGLWADGRDVRTVSGARVLVVGAGDIGRAFAGMAKALGAYTVGVKRTPAPCPDCFDELHTIGELDELLPGADVVALVLPATPETAGLFDAARIGRMKDGAVLLNCGRGSAVDTDALCAALDSGKLAGAGLDVTDPEPLPKEHPLWRQENAVITPHVAGGDRLESTARWIVGLCQRNLKAYLAGEPLENVVTPERKY